MALLIAAAGRATGHGWSVSNIDVTVITDRPKLAPHRLVIESALSAAVGGPVTVKGKRTEGIDGLGGGVQAHAVALVVKR